MAKPGINVWDSRELRALITALRGAHKELQTQIRKHTKEQIVPELQAVMSKHATTALEQTVLVRTARATVSNQNIKLRAGGSSRKLRGGLVPKRDAHAVEFGGDHNARTTYVARSKNGLTFRVTRRTRRQLKPRRRSGYVFFPTVADLTPRILSLWVQTAVRTLAEAVERRG